MDYSESELKSPWFSSYWQSLRSLVSKVIIHQHGPTPKKCFSQPYAALCAEIQKLTDLPCLVMAAQLWSGRQCAFTEWKVQKFKRNSTAKHKASVLFLPHTDVWTIFLVCYILICLRDAVPALVYRSKEGHRSKVYVIKAGDRLIGCVLSISFPPLSQRDRKPPCVTNLTVAVRVCFFLHLTGLSESYWTVRAFWCVVSYRAPLRARCSLCVLSYWTLPGASGSPVCSTEPTNIP